MDGEAADAEIDRGTESRILINCTPFFRPLIRPLIRSLRVEPDGLF